VVTPEVVITITSSEFVGPVRAIYECNCDVIIISDGNTVNQAMFQLTTLSPFDIIYIGPATNEAGDDKIWDAYSITNITQQQSCISPAGGITTSTTSTTEFTTTTSTTSIYPCYKWEVTGPIVVWYDDCSGLPQSLSVPSGSTQQYCTKESSGAEGTLIGPCDI
jgi:hypothetical protein